MLIIQYQFTNITSQENELIPEFNEWLCNQMFDYINTKINRKKISLRISYLYKVSWVKWLSHRKFIDVQSIMQAIYSSFKATEYKNNLWKIEVDDNILIPNTTTSIARLIRFINFGDINNRGTGIFTNLQAKFNHQFLNGMWRIYITRKLGMVSQVKIISDRS